MSINLKTPGVYIQELDAFGNSVVPVPTSVPVFIGYTETTTYKGKSLLQKLIKISSLMEFLEIFGSNPPKVKYNLLQGGDKEDTTNNFTANDTEYSITRTSVNYRMYSSLKFFYENGGGDCYVMSIGVFDYSKKVLSDTTDFMEAIDLLKKEMPKATWS